MSADTEFSVADAKQAYLRWNKSQYKKLIESMHNDAYTNIQLIPFFLQINHKLLPGYVGVDAPQGVYAYDPDKKIINEVKKINSKFRFQQEGVIKNYSIESIFFQQNIIENINSCWVFYRSSLSKQQLTALKNKIKKIEQWILLKGLRVNFICLSIEEFNGNKSDGLEKINKSIFLDGFYSESILLAGKYPVWWLVPLHKDSEYSVFVEHIKQVRYVDNEEFMDIGSTAINHRDELVKQAVNLVQKVKQSPEICLVNLLLINQLNRVWPEREGVAWRLKTLMYEGGETIDSADVFAGLLRESFSCNMNDHAISLDRFFSRLKTIPDKMNVKIIDAFLDDVYIQQSSEKGIDHVIESLNFFKAVAHEIRYVFFNITNANDGDDALSNAAKNMLEVLSENSNRIPLYNNKDNLNIVLDRILLKHDMTEVTEDRWSLVLEVSEGNEKTIEGFTSLLGLLAWCWLNRIVNHSTQVSIDCPQQTVKQIEAYHLLELIIQKLNPHLLSNIPVEAFENPVRPLQSLLFLNYSAVNSMNTILNKDEVFQVGEQASDLMMFCEQLIINSWGDVYTKKYLNNEGMLQCLCEWTHSAPVNGLAKPQQLLVFGYGEGGSTYLAQRVEEIYNELQLFFYQSKHENGRFIVKLGNGYYVITPHDFLLQSKKIGGRSALLDYLESANSEFQVTALERLAFVEFPLREIYQSNKPCAFQVFFQIINRNCHSWVLDEKGSLSIDVINLFERESYITHWLYFFSKISKRLKNINHQTKVLPTLEINQISINQLGGIEFYAIGADTLDGSKNFLDIQVNIVDSELGEQLSLICDGQDFSYKEFNKNALIECVQYISAKVNDVGYLPIYVTDIDVPLRLFNVTNRDDIQISHMLKFKRSFEQKMNKLLNR